MMKDDNKQKGRWQQFADTFNRKGLVPAIGQWNQRNLDTDIGTVLGKDVKVSYEPGCYAESGYGLIPTKYLSVDNKEGIESSYYNNVDFKGTPFKKEVNKILAYNWGRGLEIPEAGTAKNNDKYKFSVAFKSTLKVSTNVVLSSAVCW